MMLSHKLQESHYPSPLHYQSNAQNSNFSDSVIGNSNDKASPSRIHIQGSNKVHLKQLIKKIQANSTQDQKNRFNQFLQKFNGKIIQIKKDGHLGVVARTSKPIEKGIQQQNQEMTLSDHSQNLLKQQKQRQNPNFIQSFMSTQQDSTISPVSSPPWTKQNYYPQSYTINQANPGGSFLNESFKAQQQRNGNQMSNIRIQDFYNPEANNTSYLQNPPSIYNQSMNSYIPPYSGNMHRQYVSPPKNYFYQSSQQQQFGPFLNQSFKQQSPQELIEPYTNRLSPTSQHHKQYDLYHYANQPLDIQNNSSQKQQRQQMNMHAHNFSFQGDEDQLEVIWNHQVQSSMPQKYDLKSIQRSVSQMHPKKSHNQMSGSKMYTTQVLPHTQNPSPLQSKEFRLKELTIDHPNIPKSSQTYKRECQTFTRTGSSIIQERIPIINNKKLFSNSGVLGSCTIGTDDWQRGKVKQQRIQVYIKQLNDQQQNNKSQEQAI